MSHLSQLQAIAMRIMNTYYVKIEQDVEQYDHELLVLTKTKAQVDVLCDTFPDLRLTNILVNQADNTHTAVFLLK